MKTYDIHQRSLSRNLNISTHYIIKQTTAAQFCFYMVWYLANEVEIRDLDAQHAFILLSEREAVLDQDAILRRAEQRYHHHLHLQTHNTN